MPLTIPTFSLKDIKNLPYQVIIACLIASNAYFINKDDGNTEINQRRIDKIQQEKDSISGKYFDVLVQVKGLKEANTLKDSALILRDSILRKKTETAAKQIINKN